MERLTLMVKVAQLYYEYKQTQQEIASFLNLSRPTICRLLQEAEQKGVVQVNVINPLEGLTELETELEKALRLKKVIVVPNFNQRPHESKRHLGERAAKFLHSTVRDGDTIAVSWGTTLYETALVIRPKRVRMVKVVQCNGGVGRNNVNTHATEIIELIGNAFNAASYSLPTPAIVDSKRVAEMLRNESRTREILSLLQTANIALFSVGIPTNNSILVEAGYFTPLDLVELQNKGAVGDICSRYITVEGEICDPDLNARTIGLELDYLRNPSTYSIAVAGGKEKSQAIIGACKGGYVDVLITDEAASREILSWGLQTRRIAT
ncbi:MAG: sugar-binding transcriptional regulator [Bacteroidota bacterium]